MQPKELRTWCRTKYGASWWDCDPVVKKLRLDEAKKALNKPYAKTPSTKVAKSFPDKSLDEMKPVYFLHDLDSDEDDAEVWVVKIPPLMAVANTINKFAFDKANKGKREENEYATWWSVWIYKDNYENELVVGTTPLVSQTGDDSSSYDDIDGLSADEVLLLLCKGGKWEHGFGPYVETGGWHAGTFPIHNDSIIVDQQVWKLVSEEVRARFLRECFAERVVILYDDAP